MAGLARCENVAAKIFGVERIFGLHWTARNPFMGIGDDVLGRVNA
jgi:hypothetical protein